MTSELVLETSVDGGYSKSRVCRFLNISRRSYYNSKGRMMQIIDTEKQVLKLINNRRNLLPREGGRKLYNAIKQDLDNNNIKVGRDKLFDILRKHDMLVRPKKMYHKTTYSKHWFYNYKNHISEFKPTAPNQLWVSDITYIRLHKGHCYLALITDAYSRKIVGYDISDSLELKGALRALKMAFKQLPKSHKLIHHSDRGVQYCSYMYTDKLKEKNITISMTEENHCYENAMAERVNGILKDEFFLDYTFPTLDEARIATKDAIYKYNNIRLHVSLGYDIPTQVHKNVA